MTNRKENLISQQLTQLLASVQLYMERANLCGILSINSQLICAYNTRHRRL